MNVIKNSRYGPMAYNPNDIFIGRSFQEYGEFSEGECDLFRRLVKPGDTVLDIGANIGAHTVPIAQMVGPTGLVMAFEPQRLVYYLLCTNVSLNGLENVVCLQNAVGKEAGRINVPELNWKATNNFGGLELGGDQGCSIRVVRIDDFNLPKLGLMKVDVEGMENDVLLGAEDTIKRCLPFLYVENDRQDKAAPLLKTMLRLGYELYYHAPPLFSPRNFCRNENNVFGSTVSINMFGRPPDRPLPFDPSEFGMSRLGVDRSIAIPMGNQETYRKAIQSTQASVVDGLVALAEGYANGTHEPERAIQHIKLALDVQPGNTEVIQRAFPILTSYQRYAEGRALADGWFRASGMKEALFYRSFYSGAMGVHQSAIADLRTFLKLEPTNAEARYSLAHELLRTGHWDEGWELYESRFQRPFQSLVSFLGNLPSDRKDLGLNDCSGKRVLVYCEQGAGDLIQFCRYLTPLKHRGAKVMLACPEDFRSLIKGHCDIIPIDRFGMMPEVEFDYSVSMMSLPRYFRSTPTDLPDWTPYIKAPEEIEFGLGRLEGLRVGVCWAGSDTLMNDHLRSCPLNNLASLGRVKNISLVSLQLGTQKRRWPSGPVDLMAETEDLSMYDPTAYMRDYADTASLIDQLDLVISVDTSVAHLAGAMNKPVWLLLPKVACWRWLVDESGRALPKSPWYKSMEIIQAEDWASTGIMAAEKLEGWRR